MGFSLGGKKKAEAKPLTTQAARAQFVVKGEDSMATAQLVLDDDWKVTMHAIFDGHGGPLAAQHCTEHFATRLCEVYADLPGEKQSRLELALIVTFERMDKEIRASKEKRNHGSTATVIIISENMLTVANVGDSAAYLHFKDKTVLPLFVDHRVESCEQAELQRVINGGAEIRPARDEKGSSIGPKRVFPGGLMMTRSIGDADASELVISRPDITAVPYPIEGCTLAVASDGIWDFIGQEVVARLVAVAQKPELGAMWLSQALLSNAMEKNTSIDDATVIAVILAPRPTMKRRSMFATKQDGAEEVGTQGGKMLRPRLASMPAQKLPQGARRMSTVAKIADGEAAVTAHELDLQKQMSTDGGASLGGSSKGKGISRARFETAPQQAMSVPPPTSDFKKVHLERTNTEDAASGAPNGFFARLGLSRKASRGKHALEDLTPPTSDESVNSAGGSLGNRRKF